MQKLSKSILLVQVWRKRGRGLQNCLIKTHFCLTIILNLIKERRQIGRQVCNQFPNQVSHIILSWQDLSQFFFKKPVLQYLKQVLGRVIHRYPIALWTFDGFSHFNQFLQTFQVNYFQVFTFNLFTNENHPNPKLLLWINFAEKPLL